MALNAPTNSDVSPSSTLINPEDDAVLQAIESIEAQSINAHPKPFRLSNTISDVTHNPPLVISPTKVIEPVVTAPHQPRPAVAPPVTQPPRAPILAPIQPTPEVLPVKKHHKPSTPAEAIAEELKNNPGISLEDAPFQPFPKRYASKKYLATIMSVIAGLVVLGAGVYFVFQVLP